MTPQPPVPADLEPALAQAVDAATVVLVPVDDGSDPARERGRLAAQALAARAGARLVLLDRLDTTYADTPRVHELTRDELEGIDRPYLVAHIDEAAAAGVSATAFQHSLPGAEALTDAVKAVGADLVVVPDEVDKPGFLDRLKGAAVAERAADAAPAGVPVVAVGEDGSLSLLR